MLRLLWCTNVCPLHSHEGFLYADLPATERMWTAWISADNLHASFFRKIYVNQTRFHGCLELIVVDVSHFNIKLMHGENSSGFGTYHSYLIENSPSPFSQSPQEVRYYEVSAQRSLSFQELYRDSFLCQIWMGGQPTKDTFNRKVHMRVDLVDSWVGICN